MSKPKVNTKCVADNYSEPDRKIIEFSFPGTKSDTGYRQGGLISFRVVDGNGRIDVYNYDGGIEILVGKPGPN